ncbi:MAG TPA: SUMF1/EgtB/PvdO family nonheme iron enzyme, partial [Kofleriaceae bacterium]
VHFLDSAVAYISPESARGHQQTVASDVFTLGVLLYELIANRHPFSREGDTMFEMVSRIQRSLAPPIQAFRAVPPALATLLDCAMAPDPAARFQTWDAFLARLPLVSPDAILAAMPIPPEREPPLVLEPYDHLASDPLEELPIPPLVEPYTPIPVRAWIDNYRYGRDHRPMLHAGALLVDVAPVSRAEFQRFVLATQGPAALDPTADDSPHTFVSPRRAAEYAAWAGKRLPTNAEWTAAMVALGERARSLQIWEWTTTPAEEGYVVCGGRWRNRPALPADLANRSFETEAAEDVGFRCVQDR